MQLMQSQQDIIESYQPHSKNHSVKKRRIIGLGGSRTTGAKGLKRVKDFKRSKSAPAGFGVLEEENEEKPTKKIKIKIKKTIKEKKKKKSWGLHGGTYFDWGLYDDDDGDCDGNGGE